MTAEQYDVALTTPWRDECVSILAKLPVFLFGSVCHRLVSNVAPFCHMWRIKQWQEGNGHGTWARDMSPGCFVSTEMLFSSSPLVERNHPVA